jgi:voltage-gated potassium channel
MSLIIMVVLLLPINSATIDLLTFYGNFICVIFLFDFASNMVRAQSKGDYFFRQGGWLDLLGSVPSFPNPILKWAALLRLARLSRLARISKLLRGQDKKELIDDVVRNRAQYAGFLTVLLTFLVLVTASVVVLNAESRSDDANIRTGWDAFWWAFVTITTVGYGDRFPVTVVGRIGGMFVMLMGIGIIGALASILASMLVAGPDDSPGTPADAEAAPSTTPLQQVSTDPEQSIEAERRGEELTAIRAELVQLRAVVDRIEARLAER